jgi:DNA replication licensing factor MCM2
VLFNLQQAIPQDLFRKYILYARTHCNPSLMHVDMAKIEDVYSKLRAVAHKNQGIPMTVRHLESILRMAEANARMHLRSHVREDDVNMSIKVLTNSFINAQKVSVAKQYKKVGFSLALARSCACVIYSLAHWL